MEKYVQAEAFVEVLNARGVEYIFFNPGIDTVPVQVAVSKFKAEGRKAPGLILCLDEAVAMAAAHGHYMVSGHPQVVLVHSELGTFQVGGAITNAQRGRVPVVLCAGVQGGGKRANWRNEPYDQGAIVRNCVKWDYEVKKDENIADALQNVLQVALTEPCGPVYLAPSIQSLFATGGEVIAPSPAKKILSKKFDASYLDKAAEILLSAQMPLILAGYPGRHLESVASLVKLAETLSTRVLSGPTRMNFPTTHPLYAGVDPLSGGTRGANKYLAETDALLLIDYDLPYASGPVSPPADARLICIDLDPAKKTAPLWDHPAEVVIEADSKEVIPALQKIIEKKLTPEKRQEFAQRFKQIGSENQKLRDERRAQALGKANQKPVSADWLARCIAEAVDEQTLILNQTITFSSSVVEQIDRTQPGTFFSCAGGSIGWPLGAALGAKLAAPDKTVVSLMGDGAYIWGCPTATLWSSRSYYAPFLAVIFNNQAYAAIKGLVQRAYGEEQLTLEKGFKAGVNIASPPNYSMIAQACGAFGRKVDEPQEVLPALKEALDHVRNGQSAVLDVWLA